MNIFKLLKNPVIKITAIALILYYGLLSNKDHPDALGNRLTKDRIIENISDIKDKSKFIAVNVKMAKNHKKIQQKKVVENYEVISTKNIKTGTGKAVKCLDKVELSYLVYNLNNYQIDWKAGRRLVIGQKEIYALEKNIIGMKKGGIREIIIPNNFTTNNKEIKNLLKSNSSGIKYQITLTNIEKNKEKSGALCN